MKMFYVFIPVFIAIAFILERSTGSRNSVNLLNKGAIKLGWIHESKIVSAITKI